MEANVNQLTALFDQSEVNTVLFDFPFLFFHEFFTPNRLVFDVHIVRQVVVQVNVVVFVVLLREFILRIGEFDLVLRQFFLNLGVNWVHNIISVQWFRTVDPVNLLLYIWVQSSPLLGIVFCRELPEHFF